MPASAQREERFDLRGEDARAAVARPEAGVVQASAAERADAVEHLVAALGDVALEPFDEELLHAVGQAKQRIRRVGRARLGRRLQDRRDLVFREPGKDGPHHDADGDTGSSQRRDGLESQVGAGCPGLQPALERAIEGRDRDGDRSAFETCELREEVGVARDAPALRDDLYRVPELEEDLEAAAGDLERPLDRLIGVRHPRKRDDLGRPALGSQRAPQESGSAFLHEDLRLEIEPSGEAQILVGGPREAVDAAVLAAPIGVHAGVEAHVWAVVSSDGAARGVAAVAGGGMGGALLVRIRRTDVDPELLPRGEALGFEAAAGVAPRAAAFGCGFHEANIKRK